MNATETVPPKKPNLIKNKCNRNNVDRTNLRPLEISLALTESERRPTQQLSSQLPPEINTN